MLFSRLLNFFSWSASLTSCSRWAALEDWSVSLHAASSAARLKGKMILPGSVMWLLVLPRCPRRACPESGPSLVPLRWAGEIHQGPQLFQPRRDLYACSLLTLYGGREVRWHTHLVQHDIERGVAVESLDLAVPHIEEIRARNVDLCSCWLDHAGGRFHGAAKGPLNGQ